MYIWKAPSYIILIRQIFNAVFIVIIYCYYPETAGRTLESLDYDFISTEYRSRKIGIPKPMRRVVRPSRVQVDNIVDNEKDDVAEHVQKE